MKRCFFTLALAPWIVGCVGCGIPLIGAEYGIHRARVAVHSMAPPDRESKWNRYGWWKRVSDVPPTYVPKSYPADTRLSEATGTWFVDQRDGKRLFVPHGNDVLSADARVITTKNMAIPPLRYDGPMTNEEKAEAMFPILTGSTGSFSGGYGSGFCPGGGSGGGSCSAGGGSGGGGCSGGGGN